MSTLKMIMPQNVFMNDDMHGQCVSDVVWPHIVIKRTNECNFKFKLRRQRKVVIRNQTVFYFTDFVVKNVTATCQYICAVGSQFRVTKTVVVSGSYTYIYVHIYIHSFVHSYVTTCVTICI